MTTNEAIKNRAWNFSAGPSVLPVDILQKVAENLLNYDGCGESVLEMSHRSKVFKKIMADAEADLREIMQIPDNYSVLFLQGGATLQFSMVPINLLTNTKKADYIVAGTWGKKAAKEAQKFGDIRVVASSEEDGFTYIPKVTKEDIREDVDYVHITYNNTVFGTHYNEMPDFGDKLLVADMSSCILSEQVDVSKFGLIYAGAQKNIAPAGATLVIIRNDLLGKAPEGTPIYLDYKIHADADSAYNTPPCFPIYVAGEVFKRIKREGGIDAVAKDNIEKAELLYKCIDESELFYCPVAKEDRSLMNVVFVTGNPEIDKKFIAEAREEKLHNLAGHKISGGMRASIYNAMPLEGVKALVEFMKKFEKANK
ncbi:MAG: 3-phosphoserine/phosphohydroxythreonine transaminase [Eubacteriales bacterium]|nr:3-phosphoserine/phosphohydroxythreonine transaminase [Eubacteriales bacterium]MDY3333206.1 3-phosphoserine/phosphohydroxythreonine transaminase [Gallibacter sp.]